MPHAHGLARTDGVPTKEGGVPLMRTDARCQEGSELALSACELWQDWQRGALRGNLPARRGRGARSSSEGKAFPN
jgi:hypothetical protein